MASCCPPVVDVGRVPFCTGCCRTMVVGWAALYLAAKPGLSSSPVVASTWGIDAVSALHTASTIQEAGAKFDELRMVLLPLLATVANCWWLGFWQLYLFVAHPLCVSARLMCCVPAPYDMTRHGVACRNARLQDQLLHEAKCR